MVGEGVLFECLSHPAVEQVLIVNRKHYDLEHQKLKELLVPDFFKLDTIEEHLRGYDACFYCAGVSVIGKTEAEYRRITYDTTLHFAKTLARLNPDMIFTYVSGKSTDSTEKGKVMWSRIKGATENALMQLPFKNVYNFRPGFMKPTASQQNVNSLFKVIGSLYPVFNVLFPSSTSTLKVVGLAMINSATKGSVKKILEVPDIKILANQ